MGSSVLIDATNCAVISGVTVSKNHHYTLYIGKDISERFESNSSHEWRKSALGKSFPALENTNREWKNTVGISYAPVDLITLGYAYNYDKKLTEGGHRTNHEVRVTLKPKWVEPYVKYTFGEHRVSSGSTKVSEDNSIELGVNFNF